MAEITRGTVSLATVEPGYEHQINGVLAGETLVKGDLVYLKDADGRAWKATGAAANEAARARGMVLTSAVAGDGVTIMRGIVVNYGTALGEGVPLYLSGTVAGGLADAASTGGTVEIAYAVDTTRIYVKPM
jgi:hypothetical protein